jgi:hypothetical protein
MQENTPLKAIININGKEAIVTGGSRRIGLAISSRLTDEYLQQKGSFFTL